MKASSSACSSIVTAIRQKHSIAAPTTQRSLRPKPGPDLPVLIVSMPTVCLRERRVLSHVCSRLRRIGERLRPSVPLWLRTETPDPIRDVTESYEASPLALVPGYEFAYAAGNPIRYIDPLGLDLEQGLCVLKYTLAGLGAGGMVGMGVGCAAGARVGVFAGGV